MLGGHSEIRDKRKINNIKYHVERRKMKGLDLVIIFYHDNEN